MAITNVMFNLISSSDSRKVTRTVSNPPTSVAGSVPLPIPRPLSPPTTARAVSPPSVARTTSPPTTRAVSPPTTRVGSPPTTRPLSPPNNRATSPTGESSPNVVPPPRPPKDIKPKNEPDRGTEDTPPPVLPPRVISPTVSELSYRPGQTRVRVDESRQSHDLVSRCT